MEVAAPNENILKCKIYNMIFKKSEDTLSNTHLRHHILFDTLSIDIEKQSTLNKDSLQ